MNEPFHPTTPPAPGAPGTPGTTPATEPGGPSLPPHQRDFGSRLLAALKLEPALYEEVEHDPGAFGQAAGVVGLAALASAAAVWMLVGLAAVPAALLSPFVNWLVITTIVWLIGVKAFHHTSDFEELLRTLGFATAPQILYALAAIPWGPWVLLVMVVVLALSVVAFVRALRITLDVETSRAALVAALAIGVQLLLAFAVGSLGGI